MSHLASMSHYSYRQTTSDLILEAKFLPYLKCCIRSLIKTISRTVPCLKHAIGMLLGNDSSALDQSKVHVYNACAWKATSCTTCLLIVFLLSVTDIEILGNSWLGNLRTIMCCLFVISALYDGGACVSLHFVFHVSSIMIFVTPQNQYYFWCHA